MRSDLFGIHSQTLLGRRLRSANIRSKRARVIAACLIKHVEGTFKLGTLGGCSASQSEILCLLNAGSALNKSDFIWDPLEDAWEEGFAALTTFKTREGHCRVPQSHVEAAFKLGAWVSNQRQAKDTIPVESRQRLEEIGFVWDTLESAWDEGFAALTSFKAREGHCRVPKRCIEGTYRLGQWVGVQRRNRDAMPAERRQRLECNRISFGICLKMHGKKASQH